MPDKKEQKNQTFDVRDEEGNSIFPKRFFAADWFKSKTFHLGVVAALGTLAQYLAHQVTWQQALVQAALGFVPAALRDTFVQQGERASVLATVIHSSNLAHRQQVAAPAPAPAPPVGRSKPRQGDVAGVISREDLVASIREQLRKLELGDDADEGEADA